MAMAHGWKRGFRPGAHVAVREEQRAAASQALAFTLPELQLLMDMAAQYVENTDEEHATYRAATALSERITYDFERSVT